ncbi:hypothetical protein O181_083983 [Austropuccinia psidii MF-1]|uniref:Uncharacterized protein n=1 Tax=Austropuccinia psidii MF-1 TaxID=1389203 RepID=A0A9Q3IK47_9BASI|nr:hypothetical protein [Austropuccinia psidii MF-1]
MYSYLTVRKFLGHTNTFKLLDGWHLLMEKKNMILLTEEWTENNHPPPKQVPKKAPVASSSNYNMKRSHKLRTRAKERHQPGIQNHKDLEGCHGKCISDSQNNDGIAEKGGSQIKISERISDILDGIPNFYIAINDMKNHISDKDSSICNNLKANK